MNNLTIGPKDTAEIKVVEFQFAQELAADEALATVTVAALDATGTDPLAASLVVGVASIVGTSAFQKIGGGVKDVVYRLRATGTSSTGNVHVVAADLKVVEL
jgi:hypothetical protein